MQTTKRIPMFGSTKTNVAMQAVVNFDSMNPLSGLVSDDVYEILANHNLLSEKGVRDFQIRQQFRDMRLQSIPAYDAIEKLREVHPYLQFDTIRKIVYKLNGSGKRED